MAVNLEQELLEEKQRCKDYRAEIERLRGINEAAYQTCNELRETNVRLQRQVETAVDDARILHARILRDALESVLSHAGDEIPVALRREAGEALRRSAQRTTAEMAMNWKQQIEAQIAELRKHEEQTPLDQNEMNLIDACGKAADTMQALLDLAVAADKAMPGHLPWPVNDALSKLRKTGDD